ncbi:MAG: SDR family oxidoreductase [Rhizobiales bacterium]|nr:SDR family oxidoreductase [Hyphomicrobiales bacterium]
MKLRVKIAVVTGAARTPRGRIGEPAGIAAIAAFLASDDSISMPGRTLYADGGRLPLNHTVPAAA